MAQTYDILTDDHVADVLAKEATDCSLKYSAIGLDAYSPKPTRPAIPRPNTRFLQHIIRHTTAHNALLLAKETAEYQSKLRSLTEPSTSPKPNASFRKPGDRRWRQVNDINAVLAGDSHPTNSKLFRHSRTERSSFPSSSRSSQDGKTYQPKLDSDDASRDRDRDRDRERDLSHRSADHSKGHFQRRDSGSSRRHKAPGQPKDANAHSPTPDTSRLYLLQRLKRPRRSESPERIQRLRVTAKRAKRSIQPLPARSQASQPSHSRNAADDSDQSDSWERAMGPEPPSRCRGRGGLEGSSGINSRFAFDYDPKEDAASFEEDEPEDDWGRALKTIKDRRNWQNSGSERPLLAGRAATIQPNPHVPRIPASNVQWGKAGEPREWDMGKKAMLSSDH